MIDNNFQTNVIGRDGFFWWVGKVAPLEAQGKQVEGGGWGNRFKVRIQGYHTQELADEDLPWATALIPTTAGSGVANVAQGIQIKPGDRVVGFFLDGDDGQQPVITNVFPAQAQVTPEPRPATDPVNAKVNDDHTNEPKKTSQPTPPQLDINTALAYGRVSRSEALKDKVPLANNAQNSKINKVKSTIDWLLKQLRRAKNEISKITGYIRQATDKIVVLMNEYIGIFMGEVIKQLRTVLKGGLELLYDLVYNLTFAATLSDPIAHEAGVASQEAMLGPVKALEDQFTCVASGVINSITSQVEDLIYSTLAEVENFVTCASDQFVGSLLNTMIGVLENLMTGPLALVDKLLQFFTDFNVGNLARGVIDGIVGAAVAAFDCNQGTKNFQGMIDQWIVGAGAKAIGPDSYTAIQELTNAANAGIDLNSITECFTGPPASSPPKVRIFGGPGSGATAVPIFGNIVPIENESECVALGSVIGVQVTNGGSGYTFPPFVEIVDDSDQGYGGVARSIINDKGEVESIYIVSEGENYCVGDIDDYSIIDVIVEDGGDNYVDGDIVVDDRGNRYETQVVNGQINSVKPLNSDINLTDSLPLLFVESSTGNGAVLRPLLGKVRLPEGLNISIDCPD